MDDDNASYLPMLDQPLSVGDRVQRVRNGDIGRVLVLRDNEALIKFERKGAEWLPLRCVYYSPSPDEIRERAVKLKPWREGSNS